MIFHESTLHTSPYSHGRTTGQAVRIPIELESEILRVRLASVTQRLLLRWLGSKLNRDWMIDAMVEWHLMRDQMIERENYIT